MAERTYYPRNPLTQYLLRKQTILPESQKGPAGKKRRPRKNKKKYLGLWGGDLVTPALQFLQLPNLFTMPLAPKKDFFISYNPDPSVKKKGVTFLHALILYSVRELY